MLLPADAKRVVKIIGFMDSSLVAFRGWHCDHDTLAKIFASLVGVDTNDHRLAKYLTAVRTSVVYVQ